MPPPPPGFVLDSAVPPPPSGFTLDAPAKPRSLLRRAADIPFAGAEAGLSLATGAVGSSIAGLAGLAGSVLPGPEGQGAEFVRKVQEATTYQPRTTLGRKEMEIATYLPEQLAKGADWAGGKVTDITGSPLAGTVVNTALQAAPQILGKIMSPKLRRAAMLEQARLDTLEKLNLPKDTAIQSAKEAGYVLPPAEANPTLLNRILEGFSGQAKVQQLASAKNQPITNKIVRKGLGIAEDVPISVDVLETVRRNAGKSGYEPVRKSGRVTADQAYTSELDAIAAKYTGAEKDFPKMTQDDVRAAVDSARVSEFDSGSGLDAIRIQRQKADKAFRQGDTELGKAHKDVAAAIEAQLERHLQGSGPTKMLDDFRQARTVIARSYDVQKALKGNDVDARVLAAQLRKGRPIGGELKAAAEFGERFKGAAQTGATNAYTPGFLDFAMGGGYAGLTSLMHSPELATAGAAAAVGAATRPAIRGLITSKPYQRMAVNPQSYDIGLNKALAEALSTDPALAAELGVQESQGGRRGR